MATVHDDDWSVNFITGDIRFVGLNDAAATHTGLEIHRWLSLKASQQQAAGGANNDIIDMASLIASTRTTDQIFNLEDHTGNGGPRYNFDDEAMEHLYGASWVQGSGATREAWGALSILGSVAQTNTQIMVIQDKDLYQYTTTDTAPFWGTQASPFNGNVTTGVLARFQVKIATSGTKIDGSKVLVQIHNYLDSYASFEVTLGTGESVAAVSSVDDPQNDTAFGTVTAYTHVVNSGGTANAPTGGYQTIDIGDGNGVQPYYSEYTYGADTSGDGLKGLWEYYKEATKTGSAKTIDTIGGEFFRGITHSYIYQNLSGTFNEREDVVWGTQVTYDTLAGGTFTVGNYIRFGTGGNGGRIMYDNGTTTMIVALDDTTGTITPVDTEVMTEYDVGSYNTPSAASGVTAAVDTTTPVADPTLGGGSGVMLAVDTAGLEHHIQLRTGVAPVDTLEVRGITSAATADVNATIVAQTISPVFLGNYVGSMIGAFGVGFAASDISFPTTVVDLDGDTNSAPNTVTFSVNGVKPSEDYLMVGEKHASNADFNWAQDTTNGALVGAGITTVTVNSVPANTPATGWLRLTVDDNRRVFLEYTATNGTTTYTIPSHDFSGNDTAASGSEIIVMPIDKPVTVDPTTYTTVFTTPMTMWVRVRDGGAAGDGIPIKPIDQQASLGSSGGSSQINRLADA